jgi:hypothetical protein
MKDTLGNIRHLLKAIRYTPVSPHFHGVVLMRADAKNVETDVTLPVFCNAGIVVHPVNSAPTIHYRHSHNGTATPIPDYNTNPSNPSVFYGGQQLTLKRSDAGGLGVPVPGLLFDDPDFHSVQYGDRNPLVRLTFLILTKKDNTEITPRQADILLSDLKNRTQIGIENSVVAGIENAITTTNTNTTVPESELIRQELADKGCGVVSLTENNFDRVLGIPREHVGSTEGVTFLSGNGWDDGYLVLETTLKYVNRQVGKRGELNSATDPDNREPETGSDNPAQDAQKGDKTLAAMQDSRG